MNKTSIENVHLLIFHIKIHLTVLYSGCFTNTYIQDPRTGSYTLTKLTIQSFKRYFQNIPTVEIGNI